MARDPAPKRPEIHAYHDHLAFLRDWLAYRKSSERGFSLRSLARSAGLAAGYLPTVLAGKSPLTAKALRKVLPHLGLASTEGAFLEHLVLLGTTDSHSDRLAALDRMKRSPVYQRTHPRETEVYQYLAHWYHVAIRELAAVPDFRLEAEWIRERLGAPVSLAEVQAAIDFLLEHGYLERRADGSVRPPRKRLDCLGGVFRVALTQFHREIFALAARSIETVPSDRRNIQGHTFSLSQKNYGKAQAIVEEAMEKIRALGEAERKPDTVYHLELALFPLSESPSPRRKS